MNTSMLILSLIYGAIGMGYFVYGKRQQKATPFVSGIGLCICPYFSSNIIILGLIGLLLIIVPFIFRE